MPAEAKITFSNRFKQQVEKLFAVPDVDVIMKNLSECLSGFELSVLPETGKRKDDLLQIYLDALRIQGRSQKTVARYRYILSRTMAALQVPTSEVTVYHLRSYLSQEKSRGIDDSTLDGYRQIYSTYFNWLQREGLLTNNPTVNLTKIKSKKKIRYAYTDIEIERLKQHCENTRDRAIIAFLLASGCRVSEMTQLNVDDVSIQNRECTVLGKGNKERTVYLDQVAAMLLNDYLREREDDNPALFVSLKAPYERLEAGGVRTMLKKLGAVSGVNNVHPHKFRRTRATNLIKHGMPIQEVAAILGHEKIDTTMGYIVMDQSGIRNSYLKYG